MKTDCHIYKYLHEGKKFNFSAEYDEKLEMIIIQDDLTNKLLYKKGQQL